MDTDFTDFSIIEVLSARLDSSAYRKGEKAKFSLMKATVELLADRPMSEIRNIDISEKAGVSAGLLNTYFKNKHELTARLLELFLECLQEKYEIHLQSLANETDAYVRIHDRVKYVIDVFQQNPGVFRLLIVESPDFPNERLTRLRETAGKFWTDDLAALIPNERAGLKLSKVERRFIASMLGGMVDAAIRSSILTGRVGEEYPTARLVDILTVLRYSAMYGKDPSPESREKAVEKTRASKA